MHHPQGHRIESLHDRAKEERKQQVQILRKGDVLDNGLKFLLFLFVFLFRTFLRGNTITVRRFSSQFNWEVTKRGHPESTHSIIYKPKKKPSRTGTTRPRRCNLVALLIILLVCGPSIVPVLHQAQSPYA
jgi:hypothetical protein